ncbi:MAG: 3-hydroxybutyryl-CoA dehydrogenase [Ilumatobacteraceae bacterium]|jgi:3-hydroxybutyryl-CoA dehydrogenase
MADHGITRVGVVGCGLMGSGIAEVCAKSGVPTIVREIDAGTVERGQAKIKNSIDRALQANKISQAEYDTITKNLSYTTQLSDLADCDLIIEAVIEDEALKTDVFRQLDKIIKWPDTILATNTSSIPVMKLGMVTNRPSHVVGIHFFNPVPVLRLAEVVPSLLTSDDTVRRAREFSEKNLNKRVILAKDRAGFIVNSLLVPYILSAIRMLESGYASAEDIDTGMVEGCAHPMGPLRLADLIGLDTTMAVAQSLYAEFKEPLFASPPLLNRMVDAGLLGRKAGRGFYDYTKK